MRQVYIPPDEHDAPAADEAAAEPDPREQKTAEPEFPDPVPFSEEHWNAVQLERDATRTVEHMLSDVRLGRAIDTEAARATADALIQSVFRNQDALLSLGHLRSKDHYTFEHSVGVAVLAIAFAKGLRFDRDQVRDVALAGLLHDVGKAFTPTDILNKPGPLFPDEYAIIKRHPADGERVLSDTGGLPESVVRAAGEHHERIDGSGYPRASQGEQISLYGQIIGICDIYDAVTADRCYHRGEHPTEVLRLLLESADRQFEKHLVHLFIRCVGIYPVGTLVRTRSGRLAVVLESGKEKLHKPVVRAFYDIPNRTYIDPVDIDMADAGADDDVASYERPERWGVRPHNFLEM